MAVRGLVISDWGAVHSTKSAVGGADLEMGSDLHMLPDPHCNKFFFGDAALNGARRRSGRICD